MLRIHSEIGKLNQVIVHRPGNEFKMIHPSMLSEQLFEGTPNLLHSQAEHDAFTGILRDAGVEVIELRDLFKQAMEDDHARENFTADFVAASHIQSQGLAKSLIAYYNSLDVEDFVESIFCGVRGDTDKVSDTTTLAGLTTGQSLFLVRPLTNAYFTRDACINVGYNYFLSRMATAERDREPLLYKYAIDYTRVYKGKPTKNLYDFKYPYHIEGGCFMQPSADTVFVGISPRTEPQAVEALVDPLYDQGIENIYVFDFLQSHEVLFFDDMLSMIDEETFIYNPLLSGKVPVYKMVPNPEGDPYLSFVSDDWKKAIAIALGRELRFIPCGGDDPIVSAWETYNMGSNVLTIAPGEVVGLSRAEVTLDLLDKAGIKVHSFDCSELVYGRAGCRCMALPVNRDEL
ncbi:MAG: hypothetical protein IJI16_00570 [Atopobiaceae bacterium]|nr:hypothetical protein [Atopobiaceae bacterium]